MIDPLRVPLAEAAVADAALAAFVPAWAVAAVVSTVALGEAVEEAICGLALVDAGLAFGSADEVVG